MRNDRYSEPIIKPGNRRYRIGPERRMEILFWGIVTLAVGSFILLFRFLENAFPVQTPIVTDTPSPIATATRGIFGTLTPIATVTAPLPPANTPAPAAQQIITYIVQPGDTLVSIAERYGVSLPTLTALNSHITSDQLNVGDELSLPAQGEDLARGTPTPLDDKLTVEYQVVMGDTLAGIAARFGVTIEAIVKENNLKSPDQIREGQTLRIPVEAGAVISDTPAQPNPLIQPPLDN